MFIRTYFKILFKKLLNLKKWFRIIWNDSPIDHAFITKLLAFKVELMIEEFLKTKWQYEGIEKDLRDMKLFKEALERLSENKYNDLPEYDIIKDRKYPLDEKSKEIVRRNLKHLNELKQTDLDFVAEIFKTKLTSWWI